MTQPLGAVNCLQSLKIKALMKLFFFHLEPRGLVGRCLAELAQTLKAFPDAVDVCQVHEQDLCIEVILSIGVMLFWVILVLG